MDDKISEEEFEEYLIFQEGVDKIKIEYWIREGIKLSFYILISFFVYNVWSTYKFYFSFSPIYYLSMQLSDRNIESIGLSYFSVISILFSGALFGLFVGVPQKIFLNKHLNNTQFWIRLTIFAYAWGTLGQRIIINLTFPERFNNSYQLTKGFLLPPIVGGLIIAFIQWWGLDQWFSKAWLWGVFVIFAKTLSFGMSTLYVYPVLNGSGTNELIQELGYIGPIISALVLGVGMAYLLWREYVDYYIELEEESNSV